MSQFRPVKSGIFLILIGVLVWPAIEAMVDCRLLHHHFVDAFLLAVIGAPGKTQWPLATFWLVLFAPACVIIAAALLKRPRLLPIATTVAGALVAPLQWSIANRAYGATILNCIPDPSAYAMCGLSTEYRIAFAVAGAVAGLLAGWTIARGLTGNAAR